MQFLLNFVFFEILTQNSKEKKRYVQNTNNEKFGMEYPQDKIFESREQIKIKSCFFMKQLNKITSKKISPHIISFYFRIPDFTVKFNYESSFIFKIIRKFNIKELAQIVSKDNETLLNLFNQDVETVKF